MNTRIWHRTKPYNNPSTRKMDKMDLMTSVRYAYNQLAYLIFTIWLFTLSDLKTIVFPTAIWGLFNALSGSSLTSNPAPCMASVFYRLPLTIVWSWIVLLPFCIDNQRRNESILEDKINKSWRPLPSKRLTQRQAEKLMYTFYIIACILCHTMSALTPCVMLFVLGYTYNELRGSEGLMTRNLINALGFQTFGLGTTMVAMDARHYSLNSNAALWFPLIGLVIFTTVQTQDMYDQEGDRSRARRTLPLVIGDGAARWCNAVAISCWSVLCPRFWDLPWQGYVIPVFIGAYASAHGVMRRSVEADRRTFQVWCLWTLCLYGLSLSRPVLGLLGL